MNHKSKITILFLAADPSDASRLRLGQEFHDIQEKLQLAKMRELFSLEARMSIRPGDITQAILDTEPQFVHFSGHGTDVGGLCFENESGKIQYVTPDALASLFELVSDQVHCVFLNACYSEIQALVIVKHIDYVVGMKSEISDEAAVAFAAGFYKALSAGRSVEDAYRFGIVDLKLLGISEHLIPVLLKKIDRNAPGVSEDAFLSGISPRFKEMVLAHTGHQCSICHAQFDVDLYPIDPTLNRTKATYANLIALCSDCHLRVRQEGVSLIQLQALMKARLAAHQVRKPISRISEEADDLYREAIRLSLSQDIYDIKRARIKCQEILHYYNPFHANAQILLEKLLSIENAMATEVFPKDFKLHSIILPRSKLMVICFLPVLLLYEGSTFFSIYFSGAVKNAYGKRIPFHRYIRSISRYVQINDLPLIEGIKDAIKYGRIYHATVNFSKIQRDWYGEIEF